MSPNLRKVNDLRGFAILRRDELEFLGGLEELCDAGEEPSGGSAVEDAVVEAEGDLGFDDWHPGVCGAVPGGFFAAGSEA